jgi:hypothetical protein
MTLTPTAGDPATLTAKTRSAVIALSGNSATVVPTRQPAAAGDVIGFQIDGPTAGCFFVTGDAADIGQAFPAGMALNVPSLFFDQPQARMNLAGDLEPDADADGFGDETQDAAFTKVPKKKTTSTKATFGLTGAATFVCTLDGKAKACTASTKLRKLKVRRHTFTAHAVTVSGESSPDVTFKWKVTEKKK